MPRLVSGAIIAAVAIAAAATVAALPAARAAAQLQIASLSCSGDPEEVVIENAGDEAQQLDGWQLVSDPADSETYDLSSVGGLQPGASIFVRSGPAATGVFKWGETLVFRDDDATDFVRILDDTGATVDEVACGVAAGTTPTATAEASPEPAPASDIPDGGGAPGAEGGISSALMVVMGGSLAAMGAAALAFARRIRLPGLPGVDAGATATVAAEEPGVAARDVTRRRGSGFSLAILGLATLALLLWLVRRS